MSGASTFAALNHDFETRRKKQDSSDGGGGHPKIELSKAGRGLKIVVKVPRVRSAPRWSTSRRPDKINAVVISNWVRNDKKAAGRLRGALRYNQERERGRDEEERTFYTHKEDKLDRDDIRAEIREKFGKDIAFHTIILSPGDNSIDIKEFTRETMDEWQERLGYRIDYYAIEHKNTEHYHAHIIIPASSIDRASDIRFDREDLTDLREIANDHIARERMIDRTFDRAVDREFGFDRQEGYDRDLQDEFHMGSKDYREDQEAAGLGTYGDYVKDWKELGIGREYDLGGKSWESDKQMVDDLFSTSANETDRQEDWDKEIGADLSHEGQDHEDQAEENVGEQLDTDTRMIDDAMMSDDDRERDDDDGEGGRHR